MLALGSNARILLHVGPADLRKGIEGLCYLVETQFKRAPTDGAYFVFLNKTKDRMKVLYWDSDGFAIWYKVLQQGRFPKIHSSKMQLDRREFFMLLEGVIPKRMCKRFKMD